MEGASALGVESHPWSSWPLWRPAWRELAEVCPQASFFLTPEWVESWLEAFGQQLEPRILLFRCTSAGDGSVVGICLVGFRTEWRGPFAVRRAYLNTAGEDEADEACVEHNSLLCRSGWEAAVGARLCDYLEGQRWHEFVASGMAEGSALDALIGSRLGQLTVLRRDADDYYVDLRELNGGDNDGLLAFSRNTREQVRRSIRLFEQDGPLGIQTATTVSEALEFLDELATLHRATWKARGKSGVFTSPRFRDFHHRLIRRALPRGAIQLLRVRAGERVLAVLYNFVHAGRVSFYQSGLQTTSDNRLKPGLVAHVCAINYCRKAGLLEYDFLAGDGRYKRSLATDSRHLSWVVFQRPSLKFRVITALRGVRNRFPRQGTAGARGRAGDRRREWAYVRGYSFSRLRPQRLPNPW